MTEVELSGEVISRAIKLIEETFRKNKIPMLEGICALKALADIAEKRGDCKIEVQDVTLPKDMQ